MATCYNRNTTAYKALLDSYDSPIVVDSIINGWQVANKSSSIPTLFDVEQFIESQKKQTDFQEKVVNSLNNAMQAIVEINERLQRLEEKS